MSYDLPELSEKQNEFVKQYIINGFNATEAYKTAYNTTANTATCHVEASRLLKNPKITPWIAHYRKNMQEHIEQEINYTIDDAFNEFEDMKIIALESKDLYGRPNVQAANKAIEMKCKLKGLMQDDAQVNNNVVVQMGEVEVDGVPLELNIGEDIINENKTSENS